jgi:hypothetical protein
VETIQIGKLRLVVAPDDVADDRRERLTRTSKPKQKPKCRKRMSQAKLIFARASLHGIRGVRKVGNGGLIDQPIESNGWRVMPPSLYKGIIPRDAWETAEMLTKGIAIKGYVIADDKRTLRRRWQSFATRVPKISPDWQRIATVTGRVAAAIALAGAIISFFPLVLGLGAIGVALAYDPLLIAVTAEDEWICLYEWWD